MPDHDAEFAPVDKSPRERWGTCCPNDPECEHSFLDDAALTRWMDTPISDEAAALNKEGKA